MGLFKKLGIDPSESSIDWELKPSDTFGMFESWGGKERVRNKNERFYYFYIDNWQPPASLFLMERGIKHAKILARIMGPQEIIDRCVVGQGKATTLDASYAINDELRDWLKTNVVDSENDSFVIPVASDEVVDPKASGLPGKDAILADIPLHTLRSTPLVFPENRLDGLVSEAGLYDRKINPEGEFPSSLVDNGDQLTVTDRASNLMWQRGGCDINSIRTIQNWLEELNKSNFAGFSDWRLPTIEEGLSILIKEKNDRGQFLNACFSAAQPFIFTADQRDPGGHWFIDFTQARVFWASGFNPGGFGRVCRTILYN